MKILFFRSVLAFVMVSTTAFALPSDSVIPEFNQIIQFSEITSGYIEDATSEAISDLDNKLKTIYEIPSDKRTFNNTARAYDAAYDEYSTISSAIYLMGSTHPDDDIRNSANDAIVKFSKYENELQLNEDLYRSFKEYSATSEAKKLTGYKEKYLRETIRDFERNGFALSKQKRDQLKEIQDRLSVLSNRFSRNIAEYQDFLIVGEKELEGLDDDYKQARQQQDGSYKIDLSYPSYRPFMQLSESENARKELYLKYMNRASDKNLVTLEKVVLNRMEMADLLGYKTFAEYRLETRMAKNPQTVWDFENSLIEKVREKGSIDYNEVLQVKREKTGNDTASVVNAWEYSYYNNILKKEKYQVDAEKVKEYFEMNNVLDGLFSITQKLFGVEYKEIKNPSVWHKDVRLFEVIDGGNVIGRFYLDLYPRENKYRHAACFPVIKGRATGQGYQIPVAALVCNFPEPTESKPALMSHNQVETFFHEFGHVLHNMLTRAELSGFSGTSVSRDFVEAPSQIFENWTWDYNSLKLFARHYETGEVLPEDLFKKMDAAKNVGSGNSTLFQIFYGLIDMTIHDKYNPNETRTTTDIVKELQTQIVFTPFVEGTNFQAAFGHLMGYAASYYGYLWSNVYAQDMFSVFETKGILDEETGKRYRDIILAEGGSREAIDLVKEFLGREPNPEAFYKSLGL
ncbi:MAG: Zn-dependent oligopeptidase [Calditrichaeota bacterium]|nr:Zn-dependent oligopeptidase [Calditrichota bacterium]